MALKALSPLDLAIPPGPVPLSVLLLYALPAQSLFSYRKAPCSFLPWAFAMPFPLPGTQSHFPATRREKKRTCSTVLGIPFFMALIAAWCCHWNRWILRPLDTCSTGVTPPPEDVDSQLFRARAATFCQLLPQRACVLVAEVDESLSSPAPWCVFVYCPRMTFLSMDFPIIYLFQW